MSFPALQLYRNKNINFREIIEGKENFMRRRSKGGWVGKICSMLLCSGSLPGLRGANSCSLTLMLWSDYFGFCSPLVFEIHRRWWFCLQILVTCNNLYVVCCAFRVSWFVLVSYWVVCYVVVYGSVFVRYWYVHGSVLVCSWYCTGTLPGTLSDRFRVFWCVDGRNKPVFRPWVCSLL